MAKKYKHLNKSTFTRAKDILEIEGITTAQAATITKLSRPTLSKIRRASTFEDYLALGKVYKELYKKRKEITNHTRYSLEADELLIEHEQKATSNNVFEETNVAVARSKASVLYNAICSIEKDALGLKKIFEGTDSGREASVVHHNIQQARLWLAELMDR